MQFRRLLAISTFVLLITPGASLMAASEDRVRITVKLNTRYDDSETSRRAVTQFVDFFPPEADRLRSGETVNLFIIRRYRFGPSELPKTYAILKAYICRLNNIASDIQPLSSRIILAPPLPRRARPYPRLTNPYNALPKIATFRPSLAAETLTLTQVRPTEQYFRRGARTTVINAELPRAAVEAKRSSPLFASPALHTAAAAVKLHMQPAGCGAGGGTGSFLDDATRVAIAAALKTPLRRRTYVFVMDSGWPDESSYNSSVQRLETTLATLRAKYHLKPYVRQQPAAFHSLDPSKSSTHVFGVAKALNELTNLDTNERVRIIYVPLALDQQDLDLYRNLFETYYAFTWSTSLNATTSAGQKLS